MAKALAIQLEELQNGKNDKAVIQDANDFQNWAKDNENAIKFYFIASTDYENAANFLNNACENIKPVVGTMKLHPVLPHGSNKIWVRNTCCFNSCCFIDNSFQPQPNNSCQGQHLTCLNSKTSNLPQKLSNSDGILPQLNDYVAAVYEGDKKVYIGKVTDVDQTDVNVSFLEHQGEISRKSIFVELRKKDQVWIELKDLLCILPAPLETKRGKKFNEDVLVNVNEHFSHWKKINLQLYFSF